MLFRINIRLRKKLFGVKIRVRVRVMRVNLGIRQGLGLE